MATSEPPLTFGQQAVLRHASNIQALERQLKQMVSDTNFRFEKFRQMDVSRKFHVIREPSDWTRLKDEFFSRLSACGVLSFDSERQWQWGRVHRQKPIVVLVGTLDMHLAFFTDWESDTSAAQDIPQEIVCALTDKAYTKVGHSILGDYEACEIKPVGPIVDLLTFWDNCRDFPTEEEKLLPSYSRWSSLGNMMATIHKDGLTDHKPRDKVKFLARHKAKGLREKHLRGKFTHWRKKYRLYDFRQHQLHDPEPCGYCFVDLACVFTIMAAAALERIKWNNSDFFGMTLTEVFFETLKSSMIYPDTNWVFNPRNFVEDAEAPGPSRRKGKRSKKSARPSAQHPDCFWDTPGGWDGETPARAATPDSMIDRSTAATRAVDNEVEIISPRPSPDRETTPPSREVRSEVHVVHRGIQQPRGRGLSLASDPGPSRRGQKRSRDTMPIGRLNTKRMKLGLPSRIRVVWAEGQYFNNPGVPACWVCGEAGHDRDDIDKYGQLVCRRRYEDTICDYCSQTGHIVKVCRTLHSYCKTCKYRGHFDEMHRRKDQPRFWEVRNRQEDFDRFDQYINRGMYTRRREHYVSYGLFIIPPSIRNAARNLKYSKLYNRGNEEALRRIKGMINGTVSIEEFSGEEVVPNCDEGWDDNLQS
jgi:hypothetical protein